MQWLGHEPGGEGAEMLAETLTALAALAGNTVVAAAATDAWEAARQGFARLLGRGDPDRTKMAEQRLAETREQVTVAEGKDLEQARAALAERWAGRRADLLRRAEGRAGGGRRAGGSAVAAQRIAEVLTVLERAFGPDHADTLTTRDWLARWTGDAGDPATARDLYAELLPVRERVLGAKHPDTLTARANLARWTKSAAGGSGESSSIII